MQLAQGSSCLHDSMRQTFEPLCSYTLRSSSSRTPKPRERSTLVIMSSSRRSGCKRARRSICAGGGTGKASLSGRDFWMALWMAAVWCATAKAVLVVALPAASRPCSRASSREILARRNSTLSAAAALPMDALTSGALTAV